MMTTNNIVEQIQKSQKIAIFAHRNPDPDAYGSMFAMREICRNLGKDADIIAIKNKDGYLNYLFPLDEVKANFKAVDYDLVIMVDCHLVMRLASVFAEEIQKSENIIIIDHHNIVNNEFPISKNYLIKDEYAATCEILTELIVDMKMEITQTMANYLYTGLMGDTDRFLHNNLTKHVFETGLLLFEKHADVQHIYDYLYRFKTKEQMELNKLLLNIITFVEDGKAAYAIFTLEDMKNLNADQEDVKMYSNEMVKIKDVSLSILCIEYKKDFYKFSLRSNKGIDTLLLSTKLGGGGHVCASAFEMKISQEELKTKLPLWAKEILNG